MRNLASVALKVYRLLLICYPAGFQAEFSDEMQAVFTEAMTEAQRLGKGQPRRLFWRELRDWPGSMAREHL